VPYYKCKHSINESPYIVNESRWYRFSKLVFSLHGVDKHGNSKLNKKQSINRSPSHRYKLIKGVKLESPQAYIHPQL
jgi:hypothetical protein